MKFFVHATLISSKNKLSLYSVVRSQRHLAQVLLCHSPFVDFYSFPVLFRSRVLFLGGEINCSEEKSAQFAALLCQCQYGDFEKEK